MKVPVYLAKLTFFQIRLVLFYIRCNLDENQIYVGNSELLLAQFWTTDLTKMISEDERNDQSAGTVARAHRCLYYCFLIWSSGDRDEENVRAS